MGFGFVNVKSGGFVKEEATRGRGIKGSVVGFERGECEEEESYEEEEGTNGKSGLCFGENKVVVGVGISGSE